MIDSRPRDGPDFNVARIALLYGKQDISCPIQLHIHRIALPNGYLGGRTGRA